ncbi:MAG TPA: hypothetical protein VI819_00945 [Patescibacteria group bacterium]|nr:hypothetical protein [Patescibacteria group bacterium]
MKDIKFNLNSLGKDARAVGIIVFGYVILLVMFIAGFNNFYRNITSILSNIKTSENDIKAFSAKAESLTVIEEKLPSNMLDIQIAVPDDEPILFLYTNIKRLVSENNLVPVSVDLILADKSEAEMSVSKLNIILNGSKKDMLNLVTQIKTIAPATTIDTIDFEKYANDVSIGATINLQTYSSPLPKVIPSGKSSIQKLTPTEEEVIQDLLSLTKPPVKSYEAQEKKSGQIDPFNIFFENPTPTPTP